MYPWIRKSVAGRPLRPGAFKAHYVTQKGDNSKTRYVPMLEMVDLESGIRYALQSVNSRAAAYFRKVFQVGGLRNLSYSIERVSVGKDTYKALVVHSKSRGDIIVFRIGKVFGVTNKFVDNLTERIAELTTQRAVTASMVAAANQLNISFGELIGREPSPFLEIEEKQYGSRFHMCSDALGAAYENRLAELTASK